MATRAERFEEKQRLENIKHEVSKHEVAEKVEKIAKRKKERKEATVPEEIRQDYWGAAHNKAHSSWTKKVHDATTMAATPLPFLHNDLSKSIPLMPGNLVAVCGYTNGGKTSVMTQLAADAVLAGKKVFFISNEERSGDMLAMVAALTIGKNPLSIEDIHNEPLAEQQRLQNAIDALQGKFGVLCHEDVGTTRTTVILQMLEDFRDMPQNQRPDMIIVDYITNIWKPGAGTENRYDQLEEFAQEVKNMINTLPFPVVFGAQLHSESKRGKGADLDTRLLMGGSLLRVATQAVEVVAFKDIRMSAVIVHKARRRLAKTYVFNFAGGKLCYTSLPGDEEKLKVYLGKQNMKIKGIN